MAFLSRRWAIRILNSLGGPLSLLGIGELDVKQIRALACRKTGLVEQEFDSINHPLELIIRSYREDSNLTLLGRLIAKNMLASLLANRLRIHEFAARNPGIHNERIIKPVIVVGLPRSGTSLLYNLIARDPLKRALRFWETCCPVSPAIGSRPDCRIEEAKKLVSSLERSLPELASIHRIDPIGPEECTGLLLNTFCTPYFRGRLPHYRGWLFGEGMKSLGQAYEEYVQQLQILQHGAGPTNWILKSPSHMWGLTDLLRQVPTAHVIYLRRDEKSSVASLCSLTRTLDTLSYRRVDPFEIGQRTMEIVSHLVGGGRAALGSEFAGRIFQIGYDDLVREPIATVQSVYQRFDMEFTDSARRQMIDFLAGDTANRNAPHRYSLSEFGLTESDLETIRNDR